MRLKREFDEVYKRRVLDIRKALKPIKYRNKSHEMGFVAKSNSISINSEDSLDSYREESMSIATSTSVVKANNSYG